MKICEFIESVRQKDEAVAEKIAEICAGKEDQGIDARISTHLYERAVAELSVPTPIIEN